MICTNPCAVRGDLIVKGKAHTVDVKQKGLFVLGHIFEIELVAEVNHLLRESPHRNIGLGDTYRKFCLK